MVDLRTVPMAERRVLAGECERLAWAGVDPVQIRKQLGVSYKAYSRWAKIYGFRQGDVFPERPRAGAPVTTAAGTGGWVGSGRYTLGLGSPDDAAVRITGEGHPGWTGGAAVSRERYGALRDGRRNELAASIAGQTAGDLLREVRDAVAAGDYARADRLLTAWRAQQRRDAGLSALEALVAADEAAAGALPEGWKAGDMVSRAQIGAMDDDALREHVAALIAPR